MRKVWVTRSQPGAEKSAQALRRSGYEPITVPLLEITLPETMPPVPPRDAVLIITSQNALNALVKLSLDRHWSLICVGDATADIAKNYGFDDVHSASGTSKDVTQYIENTYAKDTHRFWHLSGNNVRGSIVEDLTLSGFTASRQTIYISCPVQTLPEMEMEDIYYVLLYSPLAAQTLCNLDVKTNHMRAVSLSEAVDLELAGMVFKSRHIASEPTEHALIRALDCAP